MFKLYVIITCVCISVAATGCPQETNTEHLPASYDDAMQIYKQGAVIATM